ncbi:MAG TPA: tyrosine-type recombinase/integrase [Pyrinomonadaceae bacterium]|jgi:integrase|nr:tyrosine-type recombinase/integrase [Pyrinomonadaceae bacterium]
MKLTGTVFSRGKGKDRTWWARFIYTDEAGVRHDLQRKATSKANAREIADDLASQYNKTGERALSSERMTFAELADYCEKHYYKKAEYRDDRKVEGVRGLATAKTQLNVLRSYFGKRRLRSITYADLKAFRSHRLQTTSERTGREISIATANRELSAMRRMLNVAQAEGWIPQNPFNRGAPLISLADERKRERILSRDEETRLLEACAPLQRQHLRPLIIAALDTGMRRGEMLKLKWVDVDLEHRVIHVRAFNTKTMNARDVPISQRLSAEINRLWEISPKDPSGLVFGIRDNARMSFTSARTDAELADVRFHDLRHTAATRMARTMSIAEVGRILGHSQPQTTYRYVNANLETVQRAAEAIDAFHAEVVTAERSEMVN